MPSRTDYLAAVGANPGSNAEKIYAHVNHCPTVAAADTMLRKLASLGLLVAETASPRTYSLTEKGSAELHSFSGSSVKAHAGGSTDSPVSQGPDTPVSSPLQRARALLERLTDETKATDTDAPSEKKTRQEIKPGMLELLAFERALSNLPRRDLQKYRQSLCKQIGNEETVVKIARLAKAEAELCGEAGWWGDEREAEQLESEIAELKDQLGLSEVAVRLEE